MSPVITTLKVTARKKLIIGCGIAATAFGAFGIGHAGASPAEPIAATVARVVDGDTLVMTNGERIRITGIDTPESYECGYHEATDRLAQLVGGPGGQVELFASATNDHDRYGRLIRSISANGVDVGGVLVSEGMAIARYDSRDGYGTNDHEAEYIAADTASADICSTPDVPTEPAPVAQPEPAPVEPAPPTTAKPKASKPKPKPSKPKPAPAPAAQPAPAEPAAPTPAPVVPVAAAPKAATPTPPPPTPAPAPKPAPAPAPEPKPAASGVFKNCAAARAAGAAPIHAGEPGWGPHLDRDGDGVGCEWS